MGVGMVLVVAADAADAVMDEVGPAATRIGEILTGTGLVRT